MRHRRLDEVSDGIPHLVPVGPRSRVREVLALLLRPVADDHGLVPVPGASSPAISITPDARRGWVLLVVTVVEFGAVTHACSDRPGLQCRGSPDYEVFPRG